MPEKMDFNKLNPMLVVHDRNRIVQNLQQQQHSIPHLPSSHGMDARNSESPVVSAMYATHVKSHMYQTPAPAHQYQSIPRDNYKIDYADPVERQQHANSPSSSYPPSFDPRTSSNITIPDRERVLSPYAIRDGSILQQQQRSVVYSPPPAHGRYSVPPQGGEVPGNNDRQQQQQRIMNSPTPHPGQGHVPPQDDSLLLLLQVSLLRTIICVMLVDLV